MANGLEQSCLSFGRLELMVMVMMRVMDSPVVNWCDKWKWSWKNQLWCSVGKT